MRCEMSAKKGEIMKRIHLSGPLWLIIIGVSACILFVGDGSRGRNKLCADAGDHAVVKAKMYAEIQPLFVSPYGDVIRQENGGKNRATIEHVRLYPKLCSKSKKRLVRSGILMRYPKAVGTIVICHGFMCDKFDTGILRTIFPRGKFNYLIFNFRGHPGLADNEFDQCPLGDEQCCTLGRDERYEVLAAARFVREHKALKDKPVYVYGFSMGAVAAIEAQAKAKNEQLFDAMILDCPFDSAENVLKRSLDNVKVSILGYQFTMPGIGFLQRYAFHPYVQSLIKIVLRTVAHMDPKNVDVKAYPIKPVESVKKISVPCFFISCKKDAKVSEEAIQNIFENCGSKYKQLWVTNGRGHFDSYFFNPEAYIDYVDDFIGNCLNGSAARMHKAQKIVDNESTQNLQGKGRR